MTASYDVLAVKIIVLLECFIQKPLTRVLFIAIFLCKEVIFQLCSLVLVFSGVLTLVAPVDRLTICDVWGAALIGASVDSFALVHQAVAAPLAEHVALGDQYMGVFWGLVLLWHFAFLELVSVLRIFLIAFLAEKEVAANLAVKLIVSRVDSVVAFVTGVPGLKSLLGLLLINLFLNGLCHNLLKLLLPFLFAFFNELFGLKLLDSV